MSAKNERAVEDNQNLEASKCQSHEREIGYDGRISGGVRSFQTHEESVGRAMPR